MATSETVSRAEVVDVMRGQRIAGDSAQYWGVPGGARGTRKRPRSGVER